VLPSVLQAALGVICVVLEGAAVTMGTDKKQT
jgi:hypothetical protein